uniref:argininosuccinate lyase n=1 Tax=Thermosporothrix sp. COM3 TaxID=2490863 RepID=A0A455SHA0_9CHLR|nr:hypothetical protein KTC_18770 [Thermosporothrix sp. COM3]
MERQNEAGLNKLTGRITEGPDALLHEAVLAPQFEYELRCLLPYYIWIEKALLLEYRRLELLDPQDVHEIGAVLHQITPQTLSADPAHNMSDIAFAIEQFVSQRISWQGKQRNWHVDRSRNDLQASAQLLFARGQLFEIGEALQGVFEAAYALANKHKDDIMPGYTHYQAAQVISPGFYLSALTELCLVTLKRLLHVYQEMNQSPLGAGAMAGQSLAWDREALAHLLGCECARRHALVAVASRSWSVQLASELATFSSDLSRFVTDWIAWGSSAYGFITLPDRLSAISSAMPQKKNFPLLERIRGKTAHAASLYVDFLFGQRNTAYTNLVEVSKEAGAFLQTLFQTVRTTLQLLRLFLEHVEFRRERMEQACQKEFLGGFALANYLTLQHEVPYRTAQVIAGRYIASAVEKQLDPSEGEPTFLEEAGREHGYVLSVPRSTLTQLFDPEWNLREKLSAGSTAPQEVDAMLMLQQEELASVRAHWQREEARVQQASRKVNRLLSISE